MRELLIEGITVGSPTIAGMLTTKYTGNPYYAFEGMAASGIVFFSSLKGVGERMKRDIAEFYKTKSPEEIYYCSGT